MTVSSTGEWDAVHTLLRWRVRMIRNTLARDSGFLGVVLGGLVYLAIIVAVSVQAWASGAVAHALADEGRSIGLSLLGMNLFVVTCIQGGALYLFRLNLQGDFRTARWQILPVSRHVLRRAYLVDALLNPGAVAALIATWILVFGYARPSALSAIIACILVGPIFVYLAQGFFMVASDLVERFRAAAIALIVLAMAATGLLLSAHVTRLATGETPEILRAIMVHDATRIALHIPPWGLPLYIAEHAGTGDGLRLFAALLAAAVCGFLLIIAANRIAATAETA